MSSPKVMRDAVQAGLDQRFGKANWVLDGAAEAIYLDRNLIRQKKLESAEVERVAAEAVRSVPHVARVFTRSQLMTGAMTDRIGRRVQNGFNDARGGDLMVIMEPYWIYGASGATHGTPYNYDTHVPVIFMGAGIKPGKYNRQVAPNDIAPTLATLLEVEIPSGSSGRVLDEMLQ
jgi:hypothetical protein